MNNKIELPIPILESPHWRVNFRPAEYTKELISSLGKCFDIIEKNKVRFRGWDYPHLSNKDANRGQGNNWIASWSDFMGQYEYWRFYQSGQFLHLFSVREVTETRWREKLESDLHSHLSPMGDEIALDKIPGFISIINFIYNVTEIFEFAARLCQANIYSGKIEIIIELKGIKGFALSAPWERAWHSYYAANENTLSFSSEFESDELLATSKESALKSIIWFFERFGWMDPSENMISHDQDKLIKGQF